MPTTTTPRVSARDRLLAAADELFYEEGVHTVGIDRIIERAGVAKASLYNTFGSKDELVRAYLEARHESRLVRVNRALEPLESPRDKVLVVFEVLDRAIAAPSFRGCAFARASAEIDHGGTVAAVRDVQRGWLRDLFTQFVREAGVKRPKVLADQLVMLYDGASTAAFLDGNLDAAKTAQQVAATLFDAAVPA